MCKRALCLLPAPGTPITPLSLMQPATQTVAVAEANVAFETFEAGRRMRNAKEVGSWVRDVCSRVFVKLRS